MGARELALWRDCSTEVNLRLAAEDRSTVRLRFLGAARSAELARRQCGGSSVLDGGAV